MNEYWISISAAQVRKGLAKRNELRVDAHCFGSQTVQQCLYTNTTIITRLAALRKERVLDYLAAQRMPVASQAAHTRP
jgi:hypothetical protein